MRRRSLGLCTSAAASSLGDGSSSRRGSPTWRWRSSLQPSSRRSRLPELRLDPLTGLRAIVAGERAARPGAFSSKIDERPPIDPATDPFADGNEDKTPPEVWALRPDGGAADTPGWSVRVVPNLYPALGAGDPDASSQRGDGTAEDDPLRSGRGMPPLFTSRPAIGAHEVIINSPKPVTTLADLEPDEVEVAMEAWRTRMGAHDNAAYAHLI